MMFVLIIGYVWAVWTIAKNVVKQTENKFAEDMLKIKENYQNLIEKRAEIHKGREQLEEEATKIFILYEMTREIAKNFNEHDAFEVFKGKLRENIPFEECRLLDVFDQDVESLKKLPDYLVFTLQDKERTIGYLAVKRVSELDKEKIVILGHQFALALRRIRLYQEIERLATTDSLTEVYTRRYILTRLEEELRRSKLRKMELSILMIDVDYFKTFNDRYGHLTGDQMLLEIAAIIKLNIREIDIVGRYGGEEFCVLLPDTSTEGAKYVAERIRSAVQTTSIKIYDATVNTTVSIGVACYPQHGQSLEELMERADWALYRAKKNGRNSVCSFGVYDK